MKKINLGKLKYIIPTIAIPLVMSGCRKQEENMSGQIISKTDKEFYVDLNGDSLVDLKLFCADLDCPHFLEYAQIGDSIEFTISPEWPRWSPYVFSSSEYNVKTVNGRTKSEVQNIRYLNELRGELNQQKVR